MIDFTLSDEQKQLQHATRTFSHQHLKDASATYSKHGDQTSRFRSLRSIYKSAYAYGLIKRQIPAPLGGTARSMVDMALMVEELYAVDPTPSLIILGTGLGLTPIIVAGSPEQQHRLLSPFLNDEGDALASFVHSEPAGTANWLEKGGKGLQTTARKDGSDWIIDGEKVGYKYPYRKTCVGLF